MMIKNTFHKNSLKTSLFQKSINVHLDMMIKNTFHKNSKKKKKKEIMKK